VLDGEDVKQQGSLLLVNYRTEIDLIGSHLNLSFPELTILGHASKLVGFKALDSFDLIASVENYALLVGVD
jgi:hypothetical protein